VQCICRSTIAILLPFFEYAIPFYITCLCLLPTYNYIGDGDRKYVRDSTDEFVMPNSPVAANLTPSFTNAKTMAAGVSQGGKAQKTN
jgi:hypothetical protein